LVGSKHLPESFQKLRIPCYAVAVVAFVAALYFVYTSIQGARDAINLIYPEFWI
jgi:hypothetical protein